MVTAPAATPVTTPVAELTVALAVLLLLHVPPAVASVSVVLIPVHNVEAPEMAAAAVRSVTTLVTVPQPRLL